MIKNEYLLDEPAPISGIAGVASTALVVREPSGDLLNCGVQTGTMPRALWDSIALLDDGYELVGVVRR